MSPKLKVCESFSVARPHVHCSKFPRTGISNPTPCVAFYCNLGRLNPSTGNTLPLAKYISDVYAKQPGFWCRVGAKSPCWRFAPRLHMNKLRAHPEGDAEPRFHSDASHLQKQHLQGISALPLTQAWESWRNLARIRIVPTCIQRTYQTSLL